MLYIAEKLRQLNFGQLMALYEEGNRENGAIFFPKVSPSEQLLLAEQSFYQYLREDFFTVPGAKYCIWVQEGSYLSALRLEPYDDGWLLEALETKPDQRRKGYAARLIQAVLARSEGKIYSHVGKKNTASLRTHEVCGFQRIREQAVYIDGSVSMDSCTLCYDCDQNKEKA